MQKLISKYGLAAHLAILAVAPLFLSPVWVFWLAGIVVLWLIMEPSRISGERLHEARARVAGQMMRDPLLWISLVLIAYALVRFLNVGIDMAYDAETQVWAMAKPPLPILPGSVVGFGGPELAGVLAFAVVVQGCRHALGRSARMAFVLCVSALSGAGAIVLALLMHLGNPLFVSLAKCGLESPSFVGSAFGVHWLAGTIALLGTYEYRWLRAMPLTLLSVGGNVAGLFLFAPASVQVVFLAGELLVLAYGFVYAFRRLDGSCEFKFLVTFSMAVVTGGVVAVAALSNADLAARLAPYETGTFLTEEYLAARKALSAVALGAWKGAPWLGTGLGSFPLNLKFLSADIDWTVIRPEQLAPFNGYWYLLVERGILGAVLIACPLGALLWTFAVGMIRGIRLDMPHPLCWLGPVAMVVVLVEMLIDTSFFISGVPLAVASYLAIAACSFPKENHNV